MGKNPLFSGFFVLLTARYVMMGAWKRQNIMARSWWTEAVAMLIPMAT